MVTHDNSLADRATRKVMLADGEMIDENVAKTLPLLTHRQMLKATKHLEPQRFEAGETIIQQGRRHDRFYIINEGTTEVYLEQQDRSGVVARLGPGQHFGEVELLDMNAGAVASVKAAKQAPVQVSTLERHIFVELMNEANAMREALVQIVQQRLAQNAMFWREGIGYAQAALA